MSQRSWVRGLWLAATLVIAFAATPQGIAQAPGNPPPFYAITNARIVTVSGAVIEGGTVVVANGLIAAVGKDAKIPPEAWVIDGKGLTVYPGLIDAYTDLGLQAARPAGAAAAPPQTPAPAPGPPGQQAAQPARVQGPDDRPGTTPWRMAADELTTSDRRIEQWRNGGFTTAVSVPRGGFFPGQAAVINLAGERDEQMVVKSPVALSIAFTGVGGPGGGFPGSQMGIISYIRQVFLDAEQARTAQTIYDANSRGVPRPQYDRATAVLNEALAARRPVLMPAANPVQIRRVLALAEEWKVSPILFGVQQGYEVADVLAEKKTPVIISVRWPEPDRGADPELEETLRTLRFRDRAPSTPAVLDKAGVKFAFYSDGIAAPRDILRNAKKSIDAGLRREAALRALTLTAAEIFGVADRLGSIEPGKIANLVVADGDIFEERTRIRMVFVDGRKFDVREPAPTPAERGPAGPQQPTSLTGRWTIEVLTPDGPQAATLDAQQAADGSLSGTMATPYGNVPVNRGSVAGREFRFAITLDVGNGPQEFTFSGSAEGNRVRGTVVSGDLVLEFTGTRAGPNAGATFKLPSVQRGLKTAPTGEAAGGGR
jgi:imidazolonepropionase-like amidohydrolase